MASIAASLATSGTSKSGWPIEKLIGSFIFAARSKTLRMPLESKARVRSARRDMGTEEGTGDREEGTGNRGRRLAAKGDNKFIDRTTVARTRYSELST